MARNIEINETNKVVRVQKQGKKTVLELTTLNWIEGKAESLLFLLTVPVIMPLAIGIASVPTMIDMFLEVGSSSSDNTVATLVASTPGYVSAGLLVLVVAIILFLNSRLLKFLSKTEPSYIVLSSESTERTNNERNLRRVVVDENLMNNSATSIAQIAMTKFYPEMTNELNKTQEPRIIDKSFSNIFNQNAA